MLRRNRIRLGRWVRLAVLWLALPLAGVVVVRLAWGMVVRRRLAAVRREVAAAGVPEMREALLPPPIPEERNALIPLLHGLAGLSLTSAQRDLLNASDKTTYAYLAEYSPAELGQIDLALGSMAPAFADLDTATGQPEARWPAEYLIPFDHWPTIHGIDPLTSLRFLANTAALAARRDLERGDDAGCLHRILEILTISRVTDANPDIICHLIAGAERSLAADVLDHFLPELRFTAADDPQARALLAALADDHAFQRAQLTAFKADTINPSGGYIDLYPQLGSWPLRPIAENLFVHMLQSDLAMFPAAASTTYNPALLPSSPAVATGVLPVLTFTSNAQFGDNRRAILLHMHVLADSRAEAALLAARLYKQQHDKLPASLGDLAPLLPTPPADPFARDGSALRYRLDAAGPTVWSVGEDGVDNGGILRVGAARTKRRYDQPDIVYGAAWRAFRGK